MPIYIGTNEAVHTPVLATLADGVRPLTYANPTGGAAKSYDIHVDTIAGQAIRCERKRHSDMRASLFDGRLDAQCGAVDILILEWNPLAIIGEVADIPDYDESVKREREYESAYKHYARLCLSSHVLLTRGPEHTMEMLRYIESHRGIYVFDNRITVKAPTLRERMLRSLSGTITPQVFASIWPLVDREALLKALNVEAWPIHPTVRKRILNDLVQP